jgi:hypothetical protein
LVNGITGNWDSGQATYRDLATAFT